MEKKIVLGAGKHSFTEAKASLPPPRSTQYSIKPSLIQVFLGDFATFKKTPHSRFSSRLVD